MLHAVFAEQDLAQEAGANAKLGDSQAVAAPGGARSIQPCVPPVINDRKLAAVVEALAAIGVADVREDRVRAVPPGAQLRERHGEEK